MTKLPVFCLHNNNTDVNVPSDVPGSGEHVIRTLLARECAHGLQMDELSEVSLADTMKTKFLG